VEFADATEAEEAQKNLDHTPLDGREVTVVFAQERRKSSNEMRGREVEKDVNGAPAADGDELMEGEVATDCAPAVPKPAAAPRPAPAPKPAKKAPVDGETLRAAPRPAQPKSDARPPSAKPAGATTVRPTEANSGPRPTTAVASSAPIAARPPAVRPSAAAPTTPAWGRGGIPSGVKEAGVVRAPAPLALKAVEPAAVAEAAQPAATQPAAAQAPAQPQQQPRTQAPPAVQQAAPVQHMAAPAAVPLWTTLDAQQRMTLRPKVGVGVFITSPNQHPGAVLVGARTDSDSSVIWALPGGHLEYAEDWITCAAREVHEQTGLVATNIRFATLDNSIEVTHDYHYVVIFCICEVESEPLNKEPEKIQHWQWAVWDSPDFDQMPLFAGLHNVRSAGYHPFKNGGQALPVLPPQGALSW